MKTMLAKYPGTCSRTGRPIRVGDQINYYGRAELALASSPSDYGFAGGDEFEESDEDEAAGLEPGTLRSDRALARRGLSVIRFSSGAVMTQNSRGRCEDAPLLRMLLLINVQSPKNSNNT